MSEIIRLDNTINALHRSMLVNRSTGMGTMRDSFTETEIGYVPILGEQELRSLHRGNWWVRRIIDVPAMDMVKGGINITHPSNDAEAIQRVLGLYEAGGEQSNYSRKMGGAMAFQRAEMYSRWFGRGYIVLRVNGNEKLEKPLTKVKSFEGFSVLDRYQLRPSNESVNYEDPEFYQIARRYQRGSELKGAEFNQRIHETRVLVFDGAFIHPYDINLESADGAHDSVIQSLYECFCRHYAVQNAIAKGLDSYSLFKVAIANLGELMMQDEGEAALTKTLDAIAEMVSLHRILVQDSDAANSEFQERTFAGVAENAASFREELTAASGLPHYKLWGSVDKSSLADSGGAESRAWADTINSLQIAKHKDNHRRVFNALFEASEGSIPDGYGIDYPSIYKPTPTEEAELRETEANTYSTLVTAEVLSPLEVKLALATGEEISNVLDAEEIEAELKRSKELAEKQLEVEEAELEQSVQAATATPTEGLEGEAVEPEEGPTGQRTVNGQVVPDLDQVVGLLDGADVRIDKGRRGGKRGKKRNCKTGISCGNSCISRLKVCRKKPTAKQAGLAQKIRNTVVPFERPAGEVESTSSLADERARKDDLEAERNLLVEATSEAEVSAAEQNVQRILNESDQFVMVPDSAVDSIIEDGRFKSSVERFEEQSRNIKPPEPDPIFGDLGDYDVDFEIAQDYNSRRTSQEGFMFRGTEGMQSSERPIYGYLGDRNDLNAATHKPPRNYGDVAFRLRPEVKERSTISIGDSFGGRIPSQANKVNAASLSKETGIGGLSNVSSTKAKAEMTQLSNAQNINDLVRGSSSPYLEFQAHGRVNTSDIAEIVFYGGKRPSQRAQDWANQNDVKITLID